MRFDWLKDLLGATDQMIPPGRPTPGYTPYGVSASTPESAPGVTSAGAGDPGLVVLEARCEALRRDLESVQQVARTLLAVLEEKTIVTGDEFREALARKSN